MIHPIVFMNAVVLLLFTLPPHTSITLPGCVSVWRADWLAALGLGCACVHVCVLVLPRLEDHISIYLSLYRGIIYEKFFRMLYVRCGGVLAYRA